MEIKDLGSKYVVDKNDRIEGELLYHEFRVGQKIWIRSEKRPYRVRACDDRFVICTKPYNPKKSVLYFIIDLMRNVRGTENLIFCQGFETDIDCKKSLERLQVGESEVSRRNFIDLDIIKIS